MFEKVGKFLAFTIASFFGVGYMPVASGTFGSAVAFLLIVPVVYYYGVVGLSVVIVGTFVLGVLATKKVLQYTEHDPSLVVIDEVCGQAITCLPIVFLQIDNYFRVYFFAFVLFRLFDITKPLFVGWVDRNMTNALGVMLDDVLAGIFASILFIALIFTLIMWCMTGFSIPFFVLMLALLVWITFRICWKLV